MNIFLLYSDSGGRYGAETLKVRLERNMKNLVDGRGDGAKYEWCGQLTTESGEGLSSHSWAENAEGLLYKKVPSTPFGSSWSFLWTFQKSAGR
jgi:hypothetical protein